MKDINYREEDWQEAKSALAPFTEANWWGGLFNNLEDVSKNMEVAEEDILDLDSDRAISFQHKNYQDKYGEIEDDLKVLHKFSSHAGERIETLIDEPFYKKLDAFVDGMQDLSITTYSTTNRIGAKSTQTYTTSDGTSQVIESVKENATIEDLMNGDNFYANQMNLQYEAWKRANPDQDVSEADFKMGMLHTRAFDYKSIKDKQEEKEFWVNIVATVVMVGVSIVCPPAGLALGIGYGALEASSAITGKDWISGRELSNQERLLRGGFALLDIIPGVKAFSSGAKIASTGSKMLRVGDDLLGGGKLAIKNAGKEFQGTIDNGIQAGKQVLDVRIPNVKKVTDDVMQAAKKKLTNDLNDIGEAAKTIQSKAKETFQIPPRERLELAGVGGLSEPTTIAKAFDVGKNKLQEAMSKMDGLSIKGSGKSDIINPLNYIKFDSLDEVEDWAMEFFSVWRQSLSPTEIQAITDYTDIWYYGNMNGYLRGSVEKLVPGNFERIERLINALSKAELPNNITVYRGTNLEIFDNLLNLKNIDYKDLIGKTIEEKGFMSTTSLKNQEFSGDVTLVINAPKGSKGAYLGHFSNSPKEAEILFNAGQKMLVKDVKITGDKLEVLVDLL
ncbi:ADP-ribosyltransferase [Listeria seeligeri]|uniref:ADP-ribosyltransferase n=3 Tax=Listeria seeligeri TaxID=1640 RepID=UPI0022EBE80D|nr:ADP-ribosyltransferase [Listeria seeligeri]